MTVDRRRWPRPNELIRLAPPAPVWPTRQRKLDRAADLGDLRELARRRAPRMVFDYVDGAAEQERSARAAVGAFDRVVFRPRVLRDVGEVDTSTSLFGRTISMPLVLGPTGFTRMMHREGESAVAAAAAQSGVPYALSTMGTTSTSDLHAAASTGWNWFQVYVVRDRRKTEANLERASEAGMDVLVLTVDVPVAGARLRDVRHGMSIPPALRWRSALNAVTRPAWWFDFVTSPPLSFATVDGAPDDLAGIITTMFDPTVTLAEIEWLRSVWDGKILVKGVQDVDDARVLAASGVDGLVVSNHGGRQLDRAPAPLDLLPDVPAAVGDTTTVFLDGGVRSGSDLAAAVALGADAAFVGRAYLYGLMAGGRAGVDRMLTMFHDEYTRTLQLLGVSGTRHLTEDHATLMS